MASLLHDNGVYMSRLWCACTPQVNTLNALGFELEAIVSKQAQHLLIQAVNHYTIQVVVYLPPTVNIDIDNFQHCLHTKMNFEKFRDFPVCDLHSTTIATPHQTTAYNLNYKTASKPRFRGF